MSGHPDPALRGQIRALAGLGRGILALGSRGCSANIVGAIGLDERADETTLAAGCGCHVHIDWAAVARLSCAEVSVGGATEGLVIFEDAAGEALLKIYFPSHDQATIAAAISGS